MSNAAIDLDQDDPTFKADLDASTEAALVVARYFHRKGYGVTLPGKKVRDHAANRAAFADGGDLLVHIPYEVKCRSIDFTGRADFPYATVFVDVVHAWENKKPKPQGYMIVNRTMTCALWISASTRPSWVMKSGVMDARVGRHRDFYECPVEICEEINLTEWR